jgi:hypothetical protein
VNILLFDYINTLCLYAKRERSRFISSVTKCFLEILQCAHSTDKLDLFISIMLAKCLVILYESTKKICLYIYLRVVENILDVPKSEIGRVLLQLFISPKRTNFMWRKIAPGTAVQVIFVLDHCPL